jgi:hypothetical protein
MHSFSFGIRQNLFRKFGTIQADQYSLKHLTLPFVLGQVPDSTEGEPEYLSQILVIPLCFLIVIY